LPRIAINSKDKGKRGEREWAAWLRENLRCVNARRGQQYSGGTDSPDVVDGIPNTHPEVKRVEKLNIYTAIEQAQRDSGTNIPYVPHRKNGKPWLITILASDLTAFAIATQVQISKGATY